MVPRPSPVVMTVSPEAFLPESVMGKTALAWTYASGLSASISRNSLPAWRSPPQGLSVSIRSSYSFILFPRFPVLFSVTCYFTTLLRKFQKRGKNFFTYTLNDRKASLFRALPERRYGKIIAVCRLRGGAYLHLRKEAQECCNFNDPLNPRSRWRRSSFPWR